MKTDARLGIWLGSRKQTASEQNGPPVRPQSGTSLWPGIRFTRRLDSVSLQGGSSAHCWHTRAEALVCDLPCRPAGCCPHVCLARSSQCLRRSRCASTCSAVCCSSCAQNLMAAWQSALIAMATSRLARSATQKVRVRLSASSLPMALLFLLAKEHCLCQRSFHAGI